MNALANFVVRVFVAFVYWMMISIIWDWIVWLWKLSIRAPMTLFRTLKAIGTGLWKEFVEAK